MPRVPSLSPTAQRRLSTSASGSDQSQPPRFVFVASAASLSRTVDTSRLPDGLDSIAAVVELLNRRQPPSCDACRTRKLKCSGRPSVIELDHEATATVPCDHCREWDLDCSYLYQRKRRGRKNRVVQRLAEEQRARRKSQGGEGVLSGSLVQSTSGMKIQPEGSSSDSEDGMAPMNRRESYNGSVGGMAEGFVPSMEHQYPQQQNQHQSGHPLPSPAIPVLQLYQHHHPPHAPPSSATHSSRSFFPSPPDAQPFYQPIAPQSRERPLSYPPPPPPSQPGPSSAVMTVHDPVMPPDTSTHQTFHPATFQPVMSVPPDSTSPNNEVSPSIAISEASVPPTTSIESILPRELAMLVIRLYFDHVYCIIPVIHRPSFMADLTAHEEERRPIFFALLMAMIATTLIHVPKSYFPIPADRVRKLSDKCLKACYAVTRREMDNPTVDLVCIKYFVFVVHNKHGNVGLEASAYGEAQSLAISLGLHREETYQGLNPIESERRRRVWFNIHNADKFEAVSKGKPILLRSDEFMGSESTKLPAELDDNSITLHGYLPSSVPVPLICGFNILTRTDSVMGDIIVHERDIRRRPPADPEELLSALRYVRTLKQRIRNISTSLPRPFKLDVGSGNVLPAPGWEEAVRDELDLFFSDPMSSETAKDGYLVVKANIHVTLAMTRLRLILHREDLLNRSGQPGTPSRNAAELVAADLGEEVDWRQGVYQDLFKAVHGIPIQALAANGPSLVTKIRVVAVTLLDALPANEQVDPSVQGIADYLLDFLNIMTSIESQFAD
ncbi:hypothetical protein I317_06684 [Kwoniella heveanensis CBS 569]|nr:hypothetical protein I317_06684 [Kwoniella heveanensis CBS 569]